MMKRNILLSAFLAGITLLAVACVGNKKMNNAEKLSANEWKIKLIEAADSTISVFPERDVWIVFSDSTDRVNGYAGCNHFFGTYAVTGEEDVEIGKLASTMMFCLEMPFENAFLEMVELVKNYSVAEDELVLENKEARVKLLFEKKN